jgi:DNA mismatch repair protein MutL
MDLYSGSIRDLFLEMLDNLEDTGYGRSMSIESRIATMACKASVKGNMSMTREEVESLIDQLLVCDNPYFCPHGRPTMISFSKYEIDKKFKRIV